MTKYDRNFCKPDENMRPLYCPLPLAVVIHHHEEWDEPVLDPETGEPTGETEHKTADWDEKRTEVFPSVEDKARMGYLPLKDERPTDAPEGKHYEQTDKIEPNGENGYRWVYALVDNPPPAPRVFSKLKCVAALMEAGVWQEVKGYIEGAGLYDLYLAAQDFREDNPYFVSGKAQLMASLGWTEEQAEALLAKCVIG